MSAPQWKPGDVAMVSALNKPEPYRGFYDGKTWREYDSAMFCVDSPTSHRPLVVIDPENREQVERLLLGYWDANKLNDAIERGELVDNMTAALRSLVTPPRPDEPQGLGAVVEDAEGRRWIRVDWVNPWCIAKPNRREPHQQGRGVTHAAHVKWPEVDAVRVLSEGVTP